jgi:arginyl-tRNA synthetase
MNKGYFLGKMYTEASQQLNENNKEEVGEIMKQIESRKGNVYELWKKTRLWSIEYFSNVYNQLNIKFEDTFYESDFIDQGLKMVSDLYEKHFLKKSQGAVIADLEKYDLGNLLFLRTDGTALYPVADLPLAIEKIRKYKLDKSIYVVDVRQSLYLKQLFKVLELLGYKKDFIHLTYDFVSLPSGMMSSRTGNIVAYEDLYNKVNDKFIKELEERHENWDKKKSQEIAHKLTVSVLKFEMLKVSANKKIIFDLEEALKFDGFTAVYLQYTLARINSLIKKVEISDQKIFKANLKLLEDDDEKNLLLFIAKYSDDLEKAIEENEPSEIAKYLFDLAKCFNDYYHKHSVINSENNLKRARLEMIKALKIVLINGFNILGFEGVDEM